jgi:hypothetical protein
MEHEPATNSPQDDLEPNHLVSNHKKCPVDPTHRGFEIRNYNLRTLDGDVHCAQCGAYIRMYDAG